jgi:hypothetical protein
MIRQELIRQAVVPVTVYRDACAPVPGQDRVLAKWRELSQMLKVTPQELSSAVRDFREGWGADYFRTAGSRAAWCFAEADEFSYPEDWFPLAEDIVRTGHSLQVLLPSQRMAERLKQTPKPPQWLQGDFRHRWLVINAASAILYNGKCQPLSNEVFAKWTRMANEAGVTQQEILKMKDQMGHADTFFRDRQTTAQWCDFIADEVRNPDAWDKRNH